MSWNNNGPWGSGPSQPGGPKPNRPPPPQEIDIEKWAKKARESFRRAFSNGGGGGKGSPPDSRSGLFRILFGIFAVLWLASGLYQVSPNQAGVVLLFGKVTRVEPPGLHYHLPAPFETVLLPDVTSVNQIKVGENSQSEDGESEGRMLTGDENIVEMDYSVFWRVKDPVDFLFNIRNPELTLKLLSESAMREVIGQMEIQPILTEKRSQIETDAAQLIQTMLDDYKSGVTILQVQLMNVSPPEPVVDAFNDVQRARADGERLRNEAQAYVNDILPRAKGDAQKMIQDSLGYKEKVISIAKGEASRFESVLASYKQAPDVTSTRLYLEAMEDVLGDSSKIIIDPTTGKGGAVPYLALPELKTKKEKEGATP